MRIALIMALFMVLMACGGSGGGNSGNAPTSFEATSVASAMDYGINNGLDGIWVYIDDGGAPVLETAGLENRSTLAPAQPTSLFKIASISKMFIAVASVMVVDAGVLRLDDTLAFWLPALQGRIENAGTITVQQLLQHQSGVPDFDSAAGFSWEQAHTDIDATLALVLDKPADFTPGARSEYSNTNYLLLGKILDQALGYSHHDYVRNHILSPLGMVNSYSVLAETVASSLAKGYWDGVDRTTQDYVVPGGSMISTAAEVGVFLRALANGELLTASEQAIYASLFPIGHSGWLPGYQSIARYHADMDVVLVQFVNTTGSGSEQIAQQVYDALVDYLRNR